jgi:hypothetical protein
MQYCGFKIFDKMQYLYEIRLNKIIRDLGETDHSIGYIFDVHGCANNKYAIRAATSFLYLAYVGLKNPARSAHYSLRAFYNAIFFFMSMTAIIVNSWLK